MSDEIRMCPICEMAWIGGLCQHTYKDVFTNARTLRKQLDDAVDGLMWIRDLFVENGEYNEATEKVNEILKRLEG